MSPQTAEKTDEIRTPARAPAEPSLDQELDALEAKFDSAVLELRGLRGKLRRARDQRERAMKSAWADLDNKWFTIVLAAATFFFILSFFVWSELGRHFEQARLPHGMDPLLGHLPLINLVPVLSYGWLLVNMVAWYEWVVYEPRRLPYFLGTVGLFVIIRTVFTALNPMGAPPGMINLNASYLFAPLRGVLAFDNEFFFSGHTAIPFLYALFCPFPWYRRFFLAASIVMGVSVLLTRNHYTIDVLGAYFMTYAIYALSRKLLGFLDPAPDA